MATVVGCLVSCYLAGVFTLERLFACGFSLICVSKDTQGCRIYKYIDKILGKLLTESKLVFSQVFQLEFLHGFCQKRVLFSERCCLFQALPAGVHGSIIDLDG